MSKIQNRSAFIESEVIMKSIDEIIENYSDYETFLDDRFGKRFCEFLTPEQAKKIGFEFIEEYAKDHKPKEWTEGNILAQLKEDVEFGWEKCQDERGISSELMAEVVRAWCKVLENGLHDIPYGWYGDNVFKTIDKKYSFGITY